MASGWNVKFAVDGRTEASSCRLQVGLGGEDDTHQDWTTWNTGNDPVVEVPAEFKNVSEIWVRGIAEPRGKNVYMCLRYGDDCVKHFDFDKSEAHEKHQDDREGKDCNC